MSEYKNISIEEMRDFLKADKGWSESVQGKEIVFNFPIPSRPYILIKVFTGIKQGDGLSRACGKDAIRVCAVNTVRNVGWIKTSRVYRVLGWQANLKSRVIKVISQSKARN